MSGNSETTGLIVVSDQRDYQHVQDQQPFKDTETGLICLVWNMGHWNGYVQVPVGHIMYGKTYHECIKPDCTDKGEGEPLLSQIDGTPFDPCGHTPESILDVHGGITFSGHLRGQPSDAWWLGFDTNHYGDDPATQNKYYVIAETLKLATQLV